MSPRSRTPEVEAEPLDFVGSEDPLAWDETTLSPGLHYRWVARANIGKRMTQGYEFVLRSHGVKLLYDYEDERPKSAKGEVDSEQIWVRGMVLMACPKERFQQRRERIDNLTRARMGSGERRATNMIRGAGAQVLRGDEKE